MIESLTMIPHRKRAAAGCEGRPPPRVPRARRPRCGARRLGRDGASPARGRTPRVPALFVGALGTAARGTRSSHACRRARVARAARPRGLRDGGADDRARRGRPPRRRSRTGAPRIGHPGVHIVRGLCDEAVAHPRSRRTRQPRKTTGASSRARGSRRSSAGRWTNTATGRTAPRVSTLHRVAAAARRRDRSRSASGACGRDRR